MAEFPQGAFLVVNKPVGPTSHDVVGMVRRALRTRAVGHSGTLDPFASGVLVLLVGDATRLADSVGEGRKAYRATARLGVETSTDDLTGDVVSSSDAVVEDGAIVAALSALVGKQLQVPPAFSAKHVDGQRAYDLARQGKVVELAPAAVDVHSITLVERAGTLVTFDVECGKGTYIRALARDLGRALGVGAHLSALVRTAVGPFTLQQAVLPADISDVTARPAAELMTILPSLSVDEPTALRVAQGGALAGGVVSRVWEAGAPGLVVCGQRLVAMARSVRTLTAGEAVGADALQVGRRFPWESVSH